MMINLMFILLTIVSAAIAIYELHRSNKISKADFVDRFMENFFQPKTRILRMLFEYKLLKFKIEDEQENIKCPYFEVTDKERAIKITKLGEKDTVSLKDRYSADEVDDDLLGYFEDIGNYEAHRLLDKKMVEKTFGYYITTIGKNEAIREYINWLRRDAKYQYMYSGFDKIYRRLNKNIEKTKLSP